VLLAVGAVVALLVRTSVFLPVAGDPARGGPPAAAANDRDVLLDLKKPFASTPAAKWADGAAGIVAPTTKEVRGFSASEVADAVQSVRDVLVASRLDPRLLTEHDPGRFLDLLAPDARRQLIPLFGDGRERDVQSLVSMMATGNTLLPVDAKVSGSMSVDDGDAGELVVHTNYVFAYAFKPAKPIHLVDAMNVIVVVRADVDYVLRAGDRWTPNSRGLWYGDASGFSYSIGCDSYRKGFLAPAATEPSVSDASPERAEYFDPTAPLPPAGGCQG
jgi:hypothetical protein